MSCHTEAPERFYEALPTGNPPATEHWHDARVAKPNVEDAIALLRDSEYWTPSGRASTVQEGWTEVSGQRVLNALQAMGATFEEALALAAEALERIGGEDVSYDRKRQGLGGGAWKEPRDRIYVYLVPLGVSSEDLT